MADRRVIDHLKPMDKAVERMVSELPGRGESERERRSSLKRNDLRRSSRSLHDEGITGHRRLAEAIICSGGVVAPARQQGRAKQLEKLILSRREIVGAK
jgi:hypothetical protein